MTTKMISFRLDEELLEQVDARAEKLGITRSQWYENMTRFVLKYTFTTDKGMPRIDEGYRLADQARRAGSPPPR